MALGLAACATVTPLEAVRDGILAGAIEPETYDFAALRFRDPALSLDELERGIEPSEAEQSSPCAPRFLRAARAAHWIGLAKISPDLETVRTDAAALRERAARLDAAPTPGEFGAHYLALRDASPDPRLRELFNRVAHDQRLRNALFEPGWRDGLPPNAQAQWEQLVVARSIALDCENTAWLQSQLEEIPWFDISTYGAEADGAAWLLVQHADQTPEFQVRMLERLQRLPPGATNPRNLALLVDRVAINAGRPQTYGTQGRCLPTGGWAPDPIEDEANVDERRRSVGFSPMAQYRQVFERNGMCPASAQRD